MNRASAWLLIGLLVGHGVCSATSIVFPAFGAPLVTDDLIFAHHTYGERLVCLDRRSGAVRWHIKLTPQIKSVHRVDASRIAAIHARKLSVISSSDGTILKTQDLPGAFFGRSTDGNILSATTNQEIICSDLHTGERIWKHQLHEQDSHVTPLISEDLVFVAVSPRSITYRNSKLATMKGTNLVACLSATKGASLWKESVPLSNKGFGVHLQISAGKKWLLCTTDNALRLVDNTSGKVMRWWRSDEDVDGADFWGEELIAVCLGGIGAETRTIQILNISDFKLVSRFEVDAREVSATQVIGDVIILHSLYRNIGVDLRSQKLVWRKGQRHSIVNDGLLYFGEHVTNKRVLGVCDPKTGDDTVIYSETLK